MDRVIEDIRGKLFALAEEEYARFNRSLLPTVDGEQIIGVRMPALRRLCRELTATETKVFLYSLPHRYYEEYILHGLVINDIPGFEQALTALDGLLPYVDNWALSDLLHPRAFRRDLPRLWQQIPSWLASPHVYTKRFGLSALMNYFLAPPWTEQALALAASISTDEYYVEMMEAWLFATALAKDWQAAAAYLEQSMLQPWTHNKTIQKARESLRISPEQKEYLNTLKVECPPELRVRRDGKAGKK